MIKVSSIFFALITLSVLFLITQAGVRASDGEDDNNTCVPIYGQGCPSPTPSPTSTPTPSPSPLVVLAVQPQAQAQAQAQSQSQSQSLTVNNPQGGLAPQVAGVSVVKELPKTGLPAAAVFFSGLSVPLGFLFRKFAAGKIDEKSKDRASYIRQTREFLK